ncbi:MAG TPA: hypothetical protein VNO33_22660 [Kofleriaceae bacterium]|nr:hypothetical protein [Kofleriaceae bacterium]
MTLSPVLVGVLTSGAARAESRRIEAVHIVSRVGESGVADDSPKRALARDPVRLHAVLAVREGRRVEYFSDAGAIRLGGRRRPARPLAEAPAASLVWYKVEPRVESMSNTEGGGFRFAPIDYGEVEVKAWRGKGSIAADVRPTLTTDRGDGVGTMRFKLEAVTGGARVASPGVEARRGRGSGGLSDAVHRVSLRRDDTYLGFLTEMFGQPYIWASAGTSRANHQSERLEGSDCADFVVYGRRRMGEDREYSWTGALPKVTRLLARGRPGSGGVYVDERGAPLPFTRVGDILLFPRHVGVLSGDRGEKGVLDRADLMFHTFFASPREQPVGESDYRDAPVEIRRWR